MTNGNTNLLVQIEHATRYVIATPSAALAAHTVTDALYNNIILRTSKDLISIAVPIPSRQEVSYCTTGRNRVVHVQHLHPYFKRNTTTVEENSTGEENESY
ncbi:hypothetical protein TNCV_363441 [Trichonephila clavipes]|nr:hypothetical protein TNCV_363441 [Trichonephila clavipes]